MAIRLLDCTLRDGGHQNKSCFGEQVMRDIIFGLEKSRVDYVELGFLRENNVGINYAAANRIEAFEERFPLESSETEYVIMIQQDQYDSGLLPECNGKIKRIRVSFHDYDKEEGLAYCKEVIRKGYLCHVNPINVTGYSDKELLELIKAVNGMGAAFFTLVDTFGSMTKDDLLRMYMLVENNLKKEIGIGFHFHDNLQLAFALAQTVAENATDRREIILDGSLLGMGREPGNLCLELMMEYLNRKKSTYYEVDYALDLIDTYISGLKEKYPWGYETAYALSAQYKLHRSYAEYLMKKQKLKTRQIKLLLGMIRREKKSRYDEAYIEELYNQYTSTQVDDTLFRKQLREEIGSKKVLLVAPGRSLKNAYDEIEQWVKQNKGFVVTANFKDTMIAEDYVFCSNNKRLEVLENRRIQARLILASHVESTVYQDVNRVNTNDLGWFGEIYWDNCMLMLLNLMMKIGIKECTVVGWDGFSEKGNFADDTMESIYHYEEENGKVIDILQKHFHEMKLNYLTESVYEGKTSVFSAVQKKDM